MANKEHPEQPSRESLRNPERIDEVRMIYENEPRPRVINAKSGKLGFFVHAGVGRDYQEDRIVIDAPTDSFASVDGMGGMGNGDVGAQILTEELLAGFREGRTFEQIQDSAHERMERARIGGGGACYVAWRVHPVTPEAPRERLEIAQAGDAKLIVLGPDGHVTFETTDENNPVAKYMVTNAVAGNFRGRTTRSGCFISPGCRIIAASDGLGDNFTPDEIAAMVRGRDTQAALEEIARNVNGVMSGQLPPRPGRKVKRDNINVILYDIEAVPAVQAQTAENRPADETKRMVKTSRAESGGIDPERMRELWANLPKLDFYAYGGTLYDERRHMGRWPRMPEKDTGERPIILHGMLEDFRCCYPDRASYGVGAEGDRHYLILRQRLNPENRGGYPYNALLDFGDEVWEAAGWNYALIIEKILENKELADKIFNHPETLSKEDFAVLAKADWRVPTPINEAVAGIVHDTITKRGTDKTETSDINMKWPEPVEMAAVLSKLTPEQRKSLTWMIGGSLYWGSMAGVEMVYDSQEGQVIRQPHNPTESGGQVERRGDARQEVKDWILKMDPVIERMNDLQRQIHEAVGAGNQTVQSILLLQDSLYIEWELFNQDYLALPEEARSLAYEGFNRVSESVNATFKFIRNSLEKKVSVLERKLTMTELDKLESHPDVAEYKAAMRESVLAREAKRRNMSLDRPEDKADLEVYFETQWRLARAKFIKEDIKPEDIDEFLKQE